MVIYPQCLHPITNQVIHYTRSLVKLHHDGQALTIVIYVVTTVNYCKCMLLLYSPPNLYLYVHWLLYFK